jgi:hypothetical protein
VTIEFRWAEGRLERLPELAADLVRRKAGHKSKLDRINAIRKHHRDFRSGRFGSDSGFRTGVTFLIDTLGPKELEALHHLRPQAGLIAALLNPDLATIASQSKDVENGCTYARSANPCLACEDGTRDGNGFCILAPGASRRACDWCQCVLFQSPGSARRASDTLLGSHRLPMARSGSGWRADELRS